jgi:hypothetical protein
MQFYGEGVGLLYDNIIATPTNIAIFFLISHGKTYFIDRPM